MTSEEQINDKKKRHGFLTFWLGFMVLTNIVTAASYFFWPEIIQETTPSLSRLKIMVTGFIAVFNVLCAIALFKWKKWGFWGFCCSAILGTVVNFDIMPNVNGILLGVISIAILYGVLHIGKENKAWPQLE